MESTNNKEHQHNILEALKFYLLATKLKDIIREGRKKWHVDRERVESVAEHIYGTCMLAIAIQSEFEEAVDIEKVIMMLIIHELEEIEIGDLTPFDKVSAEEKLTEGRKAVEKILGNLLQKEKYLALTDEFNTNSTPEAKFAKMCDKLEAELQAKNYEEE
jgi:putative hydrolase of HD superfamily